VTYLLEDYMRKPVAEGFYEYELYHANPVYLVEKMLRKREDEAYVKWLRFENSWMHKNNVLLKKNKFFYYKIF